MNVFELMASLSLDTKEYESKLDGAKGTALKAGKAIGAGMLAIAGATTSVVASATSAIKQTAQLGDEIDKQSQKIGISKEAYQEWDFILQHSGASVSAMQPAMKSLTNAVTSNSDSFKKLGLSMKDVQSMNQEELFGAVIEQLQEMPEGIERTTLAQDLLGKSAMELAPLLNTSAEATQEMKDQVHALGGVMSDEAVAESARFQDNLQNLRTVIGGISNAFSAEFLPSINTVVEGLIAMASGDDSGLAMVREGISDFVSRLNESLPRVLEAGTEIILSLVDAIVDNLPQLIEMGIEVIAKLIVGIVQAIPKIIEKVPEIIDAIKSGFTANMGSITDIGKNIVEGLWNGISAMGGWLSSKIKGFFSDNVEGTAKEATETHSPSRVFARLGQNLVRGLEVGWEEEIGTFSSMINDDMSIGALSIDGTVGGSSVGGLTQIINVNQQIATADELARAIRIESKYGLMRGVNVG